MRCPPEKPHPLLFKHGLSVIHIEVVQKSFDFRWFVRVEHASTGLKEFHPVFGGAIVVNFNEQPLTCGVLD